MKVNKVSRPKGLSANVTDNDGRHFVRLNKTKDKAQYPNKVAFWSLFVSVNILWQTYII